MGHVDRSSQKKDWQKFDNGINDMKDDKIAQISSQKKNAEEESINSSFSNNASYSTVKPKSVIPATKVPIDRQEPSPSPSTGDSLVPKFQDRELPKPPDEILTQSETEESSGKPEVSRPTTYQIIKPRILLHSTFNNPAVSPQQPTSSSPAPVTNPLTSSVPWRQEQKSYSRVPSVHETGPSTPINLTGYAWYQPVERRKAEELVKQLKQDGGFLIRDSKHGGADSPFTLTIYNQQKVFNINIRLRKDNKIALGKEKPEEMVYSSIPSMVEHHTGDPIKLTSGTNCQEHSKTTLRVWPQNIKL